MFRGSWWLNGQARVSDDRYDYTRYRRILTDAISSSYEILSYNFEVPQEAENLNRQQNFS